MSTTPSPRVVVLAGGLSHERDVSLRSGRRVADALRSVGVDVSIHDVDADLVPALVQLRPDLVWPLLHGTSGEDGSVRDVVQMLGLRLLGTGPRESRVAWSKPIAKTVAARAGLATPDFVTLPQSLFRELGARHVLDSIVARLGLPLVVKPSRGGSALGVTLVTRADELPQAMVDCFAYGDTALIERAVLGTEVAVSVIDTGDGPTALPAVEIVTEGPYDFDARYNPGRTEYFVPARLSPELSAAVADVAVAAHRAFGLDGLSRTDLIVDHDGTVWFLEVNVAPGMTETSLLPQAAEAAGLSLGQLYRALVETALAR
ncbi:D-alanine--D-alanine ligase family protein [Cellulomonas fengjieae]|uniref:D-alanine--D-alanine ligase n=1 Tax=Cellulomonas fengjieae TaxID=2819978 RepID=A0ABS3SIR3_9CELL|nr:D-alanine--D-alanine ligase [Cellulomonas fengjieae]MBO3085394.1 D-alanine--D-alanine ligase [Cellulomonas fengjieae]QVI66054.1 D-alanine--D-alanine ligase [Cellulomonas fengjieae]